MNKAPSDKIPIGVDAILLTSIALKSTLLCLELAVIKHNLISLLVFKSENVAYSETALKYFSIV